ncbi:MAG: diguanylate cyclase [Actinomycetota bacterium]|nr:diguanylate cyclase [Actinomycetota bacterium]
MPSEEQLSEVLSEFARTMVTDFPIQAILDRLVLRIVDVLPITAAGVTLMAPGVSPRYIAASDGSALCFEQLQTDLGEGPCVVAYETGAAVSVPNLHDEPRFPTFGPRALAAGLAAVFTFPLRDGDAQLGALDLYRDTPGPLADATMAAAQTLADVAAAYLLNAQARADLQESADRSRASEAEHRRVSDRLAAAQHLAGIGSWEWDITSDTMSWSDELCRICGIRPGEGPRTYEGYLTAFHPDDRDITDDAIKQAIASGQPVGFDHRVALGDGTVRVVRARVDVTVDGAGTSVAITGSSQDVTDLELTAEALRSSQGHLAEAQSIARLGSWELDITADRMTWSDEMCNLLGIDPAEASATYQRYLDRVHPDDRYLTESVFREAIGTGRDFEFDHRVVCPEGAIAWIHSRGQVIRGTNGVPVGLRGTATDITERVALQQELAAYALSDELTGLHNRRGFVTLADHLFKVAGRAGRPLALLFIDMDGLKTINDSYGHNAGDQALIDVSKFLRATLRCSDLVARVGGDEFCVLMGDDGAGDKIDAERVLTRLRHGPPVGQRSYPLTLSVGVAWLEPGSTASVEELMSLADDSMYHDKTTLRRLRRVLIVEDDIVLRRLADAHLGDRYDVVTVATGDAALDAAARCLPDLVLLDLLLPDMHGSEFLKQLRAVPGGDRVPVIVITGSTEPTTELDTLRQGVDDFIAKPFAFDVLEARMANVLHRSSSRAHPIIA